MIELIPNVQDGLEDVMSFVIGNYNVQSYSVTQTDRDRVVINQKNHIN